MDFQTEKVQKAGLPAGSDRQPGPSLPTEGCLHIHSWWNMQLPYLESLHCHTEDAAIIITVTKGPEPEIVTAWIPADDSCCTLDRWHLTRISKQPDT